MYGPHLQHPKVSHFLQGNANSSAWGHKTICCVFADRATPHSCAVVCVPVLHEHTGSSAESATPKIADRFDDGVLCHRCTSRNTALAWSHLQEECCSLVLTQIQHPGRIACPEWVQPVQVHLLAMPECNWSLYKDGQEGLCHMIIWHKWTL